MSSAAIRQGAGGAGAPGGAGALGGAGARGGAITPGGAARDAAWRPSRGRLGMACLIFSESAFFCAFIVAYLFYAGRDRSGPTPWQVLELPPVIVNSVALLSSSVTIVFALAALRRGSVNLFRGWMLATILLGAYFLYGTGAEWAGLLRDHQLTIATNLFGTTFYSLVGFHAFHVTVGLLLLSLTLVLSLLGHVHPQRDHGRIDLLSWYWHFVDVVWIFVFTTVYVVGRQPPGGGS